MSDLPKKLRTLAVGALLLLATVQVAKGQPTEPDSSAQWVEVGLFIRYERATVRGVESCEFPTDDDVLVEDSRGQLHIMRDDPDDADGIRLIPKCSKGVDQGKIPLEVNIRTGQVRIHPKFLANLHQIAISSSQ